MRKRTGRILSALLGLSLIFSSSAVLTPVRSLAAEESSETTGSDVPKADLAGLKYDHSLELQYADQFAVDYYEGDYALITIEGGDQFLLVPEGKEAPDGLDADITVIHQPLENIYLVATSTMDFFRALTDLAASVFPERKRMAGILTRRSRLWRMVPLFSPENTVRRIMS